MSTSEKFVSASGESITQATSLDVIVISELLLDLSRELAANRPTSPDFAAIGRNIEVFARNAVRSDDSAVYIATSHDQIGFGVATVSLEKHKPGKVTAFISNLYITEVFRGKGFGSQLLMKCIAWSRSKNAVEVNLNVSVENGKALNFYKRNGFNVVSFRLGAEIVGASDLA